MNISQPISFFSLLFTGLTRVSLLLILFSFYFLFIIFLEEKKKSQNGHKICDNNIYLIITALMDDWFEFNWIWIGVGGTPQAQPRVPNAPATSKAYLTKHGRLIGEPLT